MFLSPYIGRRRSVSAPSQTANQVWKPSVSGNDYIYGDPTGIPTTTTGSDQYWLLCWIRYVSGTTPEGVAMGVSDPNVHNGNYYTLRFYDAVHRKSIHTSLTDKATPAADAWYLCAAHFYAGGYGHWRSDLGWTSASISNDGDLGATPHVSIGSQGDQTNEGYFNSPMCEITWGTGNPQNLLDWLAADPSRRVADYDDASDATLAILENIPAMRVDDTTSFSPSELPELTFTGAATGTWEDITPPQ